MIIFILNLLISKKFSTQKELLEENFELHL